MCIVTDAFGPISVLFFPDKNTTVLPYESFEPINQSIMYLSSAPNLSHQHHSYCYNAFPVLCQALYHKQLAIKAAVGRAPVLPRLAGTVLILRSCTAYRNDTTRCTKSLFTPRRRASNGALVVAIMALNARNMAIRRSA
jgi:hypothetical protein